MNLVRVPVPAFGLLHAVSLRRQQQRAEGSLGRRVTSRGRPVSTAAGRFDEAIILHEQILAPRERILGPDHPDTLDSRHNLAIDYADAGPRHQGQGPAGGRSYRIGWSASGAF